MERVFICSLTELPIQVNKPFQVGYTYQIVLNNDGRKVYAFGRFCPHNNLPLDVYGKIKDGAIRCIHGISFCLETGSPVQLRPRCPNMQLYKVDVLDDDVFVWMPDDYLHEHFDP